MTTLALIAAHFGRETVDPSDTLEDIGADALDPIELTIAIDEQLNVDLPDEAIRRDTMVSEIERLVEEHRRRAA